MGNGIEMYLIPFLASFIISFIILIGLLGFSSKHDVRISARHIHKAGISRLGGVALILSFILALIWDGKLVVSASLAAVIIGCLFILIFGMLDDFRQISWKWQLVFQILLAVFIYGMGIRLQYVSNPFGGIIFFDGIGGQIAGFILVTMWLLLIMNAVNWIDGIDGVSSGVSIVCALAIFALILRPEINQPPMGIITMAFVGGSLAFLILNFFPAKIMAGTSGSMFMGFILAVLAIFAGAKIATTLLVLAIPVIDAMLVIFDRLKSGKSLFHADRRHLHFQLLNFGWSQKKICFFYYAVTVIIAIIALNTRDIGKMLTLIFFSLVIMSVSFSIRHKLQEKKI